MQHNHRVLNDELAGGVYPSGKVGANAAWLRLQVLTSNLLVMPKAKAMEDQYRNARPKRLGFAIFNHVGKVVRNAQQILMRVFRSELERTIRPGLSRLRTAAWQAA